MSFLTRTDVMIPIVAAIITAFPPTLAAVVTVWIALRRERSEREKGLRKSQKQQGVLEADVDQMDNQLESDRNRMEELASKITQLESQLAQAGLSRPTSGEVSGHSVQVISPHRAVTPVIVAGTGNLKGRDKRAYLVGADPKGNSVQWLVKVHDFRGKAIYVYDLLSGAWGKEADSSTPDIDTEIARYGEIGHEIDHPGTIRLDNAPEWIAHAKREAKRSGLTIEQQPSSPLRNPPVILE